MSKTCQMYYAKITDLNDFDKCHFWGKLFRNTDPECKYENHPKKEPCSKGSRKSVGGCTICPIYNRCDEEDEQCSSCENGNDKSQCILNSYIICPDCNVRTMYGCYMNVNDTYRTLTFICESCRSLFNVCLQCFENKGKCNLLKLLSYSGANTRAKDKEDEEDEEYDESDEDDEDDDEDDEDDMIDVSDKNIYYLHQDKIIGTDGGCTSEWYCKKCDENIEFCDK